MEEAAACEELCTVSPRKPGTGNCLLAHYGSVAQCLLTCCPSQVCLQRLFPVRMSFQQHLVVHLSISTLLLLPGSRCPGAGRTLMSAGLAGSSQLPGGCWSCGTVLPVATSQISHCAVSHLHAGSVGGAATALSQRAPLSRPGNHSQPRSQPLHPLQAPPKGVCARATAQLGSGDG